MGIGKMQLSCARSFFFSFILLFSLFSVSQVAAVCPTGMVGYWKMDEGTGTTVADYLNINNGALGCTYGSASSSCVLPSWTEGKIGKAVRVTGIGGYQYWTNYVSIPYNPNMNSVNLSLAMWIKFDTLAAPGPQSQGYQQMATRWYHWQSYSNWQLAKTDDGRFYFGLVPTPYGFTSTPIITDLDWHHVVMTASQGGNLINVSIYLDGNYKQSFTSAGSFVLDNTPLTLGSSIDVRSWCGYQHSLQGTIDEFALFNKALSLAEVQALYQNALQNKDYCGGTGPLPPPQPEACSNGIDDDQDGLTDCADTADCSADLACRAPDVTPPVTSTSISGASQLNGVYTGDATVTLTAIDEQGGSGVKETNYRIDSGSWNTGTSVTVSCDLTCTKTVQYYSTDNANNVEQTKSTVISIDKRNANETVPAGTTDTVSNAVGDVTLTIPSGALSTPAQITIETSVHSFAASYGSAPLEGTQPYDFGSTASFSSPVTIAMKGDCSLGEDYFYSQFISKFQCTADCDAQQPIGDWISVVKCFPDTENPDGSWGCTADGLDAAWYFDASGENCKLTAETMSFSTYAVRKYTDADSDGVFDVKDECPANAGVAAFNGCTAALSMLAENHTKVTVGKKTTSIKLPLPNLVLEAYDMQCVKQKGLTPAAKDYDKIRAACPIVVKKITDSSGSAFMGVNAGKEYVIIGVLNGMTSSQLGTPTGIVAEGLVVSKKLQWLEVPDITKMPPLSFIFDAIESGNFFVFVVTIVVALGVGYYLGKTVSPKRSRKKR